MKFAIRDDDVSFFTDPQVLDTIYKDVWGKIPVSFAVVPFYRSREDKNIPQVFWHTNRNFPISENLELVNFLKEKIKIAHCDIMLHGFSHIRTEGGSEFKILHDTAGLVKVSKEFLEHLFDTKISVFVPPYNRISSENTEAIGANKLNIGCLVSRNPLRRRPIKTVSIVSFIKRKSFSILIGALDIPYPFVLRYGNHKELQCYTITDRIEWDDLKNIFEAVDKVNGTLCVATHYWEIANDQKIETLFRNLIDFALSCNSVEFTTVSKIFEGRIF